MKKFISIFLSIALISLVACSDEQADIYSQHRTMIDNENEEITESEFEITEDGLSGTLEISNIFVAEDYTGWGPLVDGFMDLHPNVKIISNDNAVDLSTIALETGDEYALAMQKYVDELNVQIISGNAPDLIFGVNMTSVPPHLLMDLNEFLENDPEYVREDYFDSVVRAHEVDGKLHEYPMTFYYYLYRFREDVMDELGIDVEELEVVDYNFLFDTLEKIKESGKFPEIKYLGYEGQEGQRILYSEEMTACVDSETLEINFEVPQFINYLNTTKAYVPGTLPEFGFYTGSLEPSVATNFFDEKSYFVEAVNTGKTFLNKRMLSEIDGVTKAVPVTTSAGEMIVIAESIGIPTNAKNPELAWEFIKYCIEESGEVNTDWEFIGKLNGDRFFYDIPINKNNFKMYYGENFVGLPKEQEDNFFEAVFEALEGNIRVPAMDRELSNALFYIQTDFYNDLITAEECAKAMQERADIYMGENS